VKAEPSPGDHAALQATGERRFQERWQRLEPHRAGILDILDNFGIGNPWWVGVVRTVPITCSAKPLSL